MVASNRALFPWKNFLNSTDQFKLNYSYLNFRIIFAFGLRGIGAASGMAFTLLAGRFLPAESAGALFLWIAWARAGSIFAVFGHDQHLVRALPRFLAANSNNEICATVRSSFMASLRNCIIITVVIMTGVAAWTFLNSYFESNFWISIIILISIIPATLATILAESLRGINKILESVLIAPTTIFGIPALLIVPASIWLGATGAAFSLLTGAFLAYFLGLILWTYHKPKLSIGPNTKPIKGIDLRNLGLLSIILMSQGWFETMVSAFLLSKQDIARYAVAATFASVIQVGLSSVNTFAAPRISLIAAQANPLYLRRVFKTTRVIAIVIALGPTVTLLGWSDSILGLVGISYTSATTTLQILVVGQFINACVGPVGPTLLALSDERFIMRTLIITATVNIIIIYALAPWMGIVGVACASASTLILLNITCLMRLRYFLTHMRGHSDNYSINKGIV